MHTFEHNVLRACAAIQADPRPGACRGPLVGPADRVVVAVSGGADSTALAAALAALRAGRALADLTIAHLDHGLRGAEAAANDRAAVEALGARLAVPVVCGATVATKTDGSLEAGAREARYAFLREVALARGATRVAVAHTADDQVETVLLRALRGTGLRGLGGMPARRPLTAGAPDGPWLVRPLLGLRRDDARAYLGERGLTWVEDETNTDRRFRRNAVRHDVLPALRAVGADVEGALLRLARQARRASSAVEAEARALLVLADRGVDGVDGAAWDVATLLGALPAVRDDALRIVLELGGATVDARAVRALRRIARAGGTIDVAGGLRATVADGLLRTAASGVEDVADDVIPAALALPRDGEATDSDAGLVFEARLRAVVPGEPLDADPSSLALLDAERATGALAVRRRRRGDRFWPLGAPGGRTLKRFLIDRKVPRDERARTPVVTLDDRPVWVVGHRIDERFKVTSATAAVLELRAVPHRGQKKGS